jgi:hypothetical protein
LTQQVNFAPGVAYSVFAIDSVSHLQTAVLFLTVLLSLLLILLKQDFSILVLIAPALDLAINGNVAFSGRSYNDIGANPTAAHFTYLTPGTLYVGNCVWPVTSTVFIQHTCNT